MSPPVPISSSTDDAIASAIRERSDDQLVELIEHAGLTHGIAAEGIFAALRDTRSIQVRNAAALAIVEMNPRGGAEVLAHVLARPSVASEAGTLLYALGEVGGFLPLPTFVTLLEHGSYEARAEALIFLEDDRVVFQSEGEPAAAHDRLIALVGSGGEAAEAAADALANWPKPWLGRG